MPQRFRRFRPLLWMLLSAFMVALLFPPYGLKWLAYFALVPAAWVVMYMRSLAKLFGLAWLVWALWWGVVGRWMMPVTVGGHIGTSIMMGGQIAVCWGAVWVLARQWRWPMFVALPLCWMTLEVFRASFPFGGMNWFTLAQSQTPFAPGRTSWVIQMADVFGWPVVTVFVAAWNGFLVDLLTRKRYAERVGKSRRLMPSIRWGLAVLAIATGMVLTYGYARIEEAGRYAEQGPLVGIVQTNVPQNNKNQRTAEVDRAMWQQLEDGTREVIRLMHEAKEDSGALSNVSSGGGGVVVWPETSVPGYVDEAGAAYWRDKAALWALTRAEGLDPAGLQEAAEVFGVEPEAVPGYLAEWYAFSASLRERVQGLVREGGFALIAGVPARLAYPEGKGVNRVTVVRADGSFDDAVYDKSHRVPFGEYLPLVEKFPGLRDWFIQTLTPYDRDYSIAAGQQLTVFELNVSGSTAPGNPAASTESLPGVSGAPGALGAPGVVRVATPVCFEDTVARLCQKMVYGSGTKGVDVFVNVTNDGWFKNSAQGPQHFQLAALRCVENRVPMVRAVNTGVSGVIDSSGRVVRVLSRGDQTQGVAAAGVVAVSLDARVGLFAWWGMWPAWGLAGLTGAMVVLAFGRELGRWRAGRKAARGVAAGDASEDAEDA